VEEFDFEKAQVIGASGRLEPILSEYARAVLDLHRRRKYLYDHLVASNNEAEEDSITFELADLDRQIAELEAGLDDSDTDQLN